MTGGNRTRDLTNAEGEKDFINILSMVTLDYIRKQWGQCCQSMRGKDFKSKNLGLAKVLIELLQI